MTSVASSSVKLDDGDAVRNDVTDREVERETNESSRERTVTNLIKKTLLASFSVLMALAFRDAFQHTMTMFFPKDDSRKLLQLYIYAFVITTVTIILYYVWSDIM